MSGVSIVYGDIAPAAKENFVASASGKADFVNLTQLQQYNLEFANYANPCELYQTVLDGSQEVPPDNLSSVNIGLWSNEPSLLSRELPTPITLTLQSVGQYSSIGLTLTFDTDNNIFCNDLNIKWYRNEELLDDLNFQPDTAKYFCNNSVEYYNKVVITFKSMNMPLVRLKLRAIDYGYGTIFFGDELADFKLIQEINPISENIVSNTCDFKLNSKNNINYSFQTGQPLSVYFYNNLKATALVEKSKRTGSRNWTVSAYDYIAAMDDIKFMGGMYKNISVESLIDSVMTLAKIPYEIDENIASITLTGYIPICTARKALQMICFAAGAVANTAYSDKVRIFKLPKEATQKITRSNIRRSPTFETKDKVTEVQLAQYKYSRGEPNQTLYDAANNGTGQDILVEFSEPQIDIEIKNGTILEHGVNYARINANEGCMLIGQKYYNGKTIKTKKNPAITATTKEKIVVIEGQTLISETNVDNILDQCYDYYIKNNKSTISIDVGYDGLRTVQYGEVQYGMIQYGGMIETDERIELGESITTETEYLGDLTGQITRQSYNLNGNIIVKECEMIW